MTYTTSRLLALGTVAGVAVLGLVSGAFGAIFSSTPLQNHNCGAYGYHAGYGYGYMCEPVTTSQPGGPGASGTSTDTTRPTTTLFPGFVSLCGGESQTLNDPRVLAYYDVLNIENRVNAEARHLTRAEFLKLVLNAAGVDVSAEAHPAFSDVATTHTLAKYISYAARMNIVSGQGNLFRPNDNISRGEAMKVLINATNLTLASESTTFADVPNSYSLARYVQTAKDSCVAHGVTPTRFEPLRGITVAETAKVLYNIKNHSR